MKKELTAEEAREMLLTQELKGIFKKIRQEAKIGRELLVILGVRHQKTLSKLAELGFQVIEFPKKIEISWRKRGTTEDIQMIQPEDEKRKNILDMQIGEQGFTVPWATSGWNWRPFPEHLNGLNLTYPVRVVAHGTFTEPITRDKYGWKVGERFFKEPYMKSNRKV